MSERGERNIQMFQRAHLTTKSNSGHDGGGNARVYIVLADCDGDVVCRSVLDVGQRGKGRGAGGRVDDGRRRLDMCMCVIATPVMQKI